MKKPGLLIGFMLIITIAGMALVWKAQQPTPTCTVSQVETECKESNTRKPVRKGNKPKLGTPLWETISGHLLLVSVH